MMTTRNPDDDGNAHLELRDLRKEYSERVTAVDGVSLSLSRGELLVLVGPSGCGKSTTLRCIAGLEDASAGDVRVAGESVRGRPPEARDVAIHRRVVDFPQPEGPTRTSSSPRDSDNDTPSTAVTRSEYPFRRSRSSRWAVPSSS